MSSLPRVSYTVDNKLSGEMSMNNFVNFASVFRRRATAAAIIDGSNEYPSIQGRVMFYQLRNGVIVRSELSGLPVGSRPCGGSIFGFHIHEGTSCTAKGNDPFGNTLTHYNPYGCPHPYHAGDMPPLFGVDGYAFSAFLTDRFTVDEIIGKTVVIHSSPDDFTTQPSGNSGSKIACGVISSV
jgi:Cu-Zn family superoxide dismutase